MTEKLMAETLQALFSNVRWIHRPLLSGSLDV
jgi:hypothetical protein